MGEEVCQRLNLAGYGETDVAGWPGLPVKGALAGVPAGVDIVVSVVEADEIALPGT